MTNKHIADDDTDSQKRTDIQSPKVCVDYLSYLFEEMDLAASWRVMTKQKKDIINGIRLENASWRTWTKQRNHLKTISPNTLNWLKDNDVTWLYGPLHTVTKFEQNEKKSSTHDKFNLIHASDPPLNEKCIMGTLALPSPAPPSHLKSALKKITKSDILRRSVSNHPTYESDLLQPNRQAYVFSPTLLHLDTTYRPPKLRFNQRVEQYIVISNDDEDDDDDDDDDDGGYGSNIKTTTKYASSCTVFPTENNHQDNDSDKTILQPYNFSSHITTRSIKRIEPTILNSSSYPENSMCRSHSLLSWDDNKKRYNNNNNNNNNQEDSHTTYWFWKKPTNTSPSILFCPEKSQPISESFPIDAILHHQIINDTDCHDRILDQQQQSLEQHASSSFLEILVNGFLTFGIHR